MKKLFVLFLVILTLALTALGQTNVVLFTNTIATQEKAIQLTWTSVPHEIYQIQYAGALATNADDSTAWSTLHDDYPSQGSNTFWLDCGNANLIPTVPHPKYSSMRFYRILDKGIDDLTNDEPTISITYPSSSMVVTGDLTISISVTSDQAMVTSKLYIDGQEMNSSPDGTNYYINTCEWPNGQHIIFATAKEASTSAMQMDTTAPLIGHSVSTFVPVYFSNLITQIAFSQPHFDPSLGQTQAVTAYLIQNSDWTLRILDENSNEFRTVTGSGNNLVFDWDGTSDTGTNVPNGIYYYYINASTNGLGNNVITGEDGGSTNISAPLFPDFMTESQMYAVNTNILEDVIPLAIIPPGMNTNGYTVFSAKPLEVESLHSESLAAHSGGFSPDDGGDGGSGGAGPSSQDASPTPSRPGSDPVVGSVGSFGVGVQSYFGNGLNGFQPAAPRSSTLLATYVTIQDRTPANPPVWKPLIYAASETSLFASRLAHMVGTQRL